MLMRRYTVIVGSQTYAAMTSELEKIGAYTAQADADGALTIEINGWDMAAPNADQLCLIQLVNTARIVVMDSLVPQSLEVQEQRAAIKPVGQDMQELRKFLRMDKRGRKC